MENLSGILQSNEKIVKVSCGANFTIAVTNLGNCLSWGWGIKGVLGRGRGLISPEPNVVYSLGNGVEDKIVSLVAAGPAHVVCATRSERNEWAAMHFSGLLNESYLAKTADVELIIEGEGEPLLAHYAVLAARSNYLRGLLSQVRIHSDPKSRLVFNIPTSAHSSRIALQNLLSYLYSDRLVAKTRYMSDTIALAAELGVRGLGDICSKNGQKMQSTFEKEMLEVFGNNCTAYAPDVFFYSKFKSNDNGEKLCLLSSHKFILAHFLPYFYPIFYGDFAEPSAQGENSNAWICIDGFVEDGIEPEIFFSMVKFAYTGIKD